MTEKNEFNIIKLNSDNEYQHLLDSSKNSVKMHSGRVTKLKGQTGTEHSTHEKEEILVILEGEGAILIEGKKNVIKKGEVVYIPPHTPHQLMNDSSDRFEYVYVVTPAL